MDDFKGKTDVASTNPSRIFMAKETVYLGTKKDDHGDIWIDVGTKEWIDRPDVEKAEVSLTGVGILMTFNLYF